MWSVNYHRGMSTAESLAPPSGRRRTRITRLDRLFAATRVPVAWRLPVVVFAWAEVVFLVWWAGSWPGLLSPDSVSYILHVTTGPWTADHSVVYDSLVLASLTLTHNVALLTFVQTMVASAIVAYTCASVHAFGVRARWAVVPGLLVPFVPSVGNFVSTVWKDVPFAFSEAMIAATTIRILTWRRSRPSRAQALPRRYLIELGIELLALSLFRNDGFVMVVVVGAVLAIALAGVRIKVMAVAVAALAGFALATTVIYPAAGIKPAQSTEAYGVFYGDIAVAYAKAPRTFTVADRHLMAEVAPLRTWRDASNCYTSDALFNPTFNHIEANRVKTKLAALWFRTLARTPVLVAKTHLCRGSVAWDPLPPPRDKTGFSELVTATPASLYAGGYQVPRDIARNLRADPINSDLGSVERRIRAAGYTHSWIQVAVFRGASWCYVLYLALFIAVRRRRRWDILAIAAMSLANQLTVLAANPAQLYRYMVGPILIGMLLVPLAAVRRAPASADASPDGDQPATYSLSDR
jgi:hypothetical protein